ncbi:MAG: type IX secretion system membrane protein PorP/SprF [Paludibacteraceae bacterium]
MKNINIVLTMVLVCAFFSIRAQQQPMYSQYMFNMLNVNPAYAGNRAVDNITALHRNQWTGFDGHPITTTLSWDRRTDESNVGYGVQIYNDKLGIENTIGLQGFYSYRIPFYNSSLAFGLSVGFLNFNANYTESRIIEQGDPAFQQNENSWLPTAGVGILYSAENWYAGLSVPALFRTKKFVSDEYKDSVSFGADNHYFLNGGYIFPVGESVKLKPSFLLKYVVGAPLETDINLNAWFVDKFGVGLSYRTGDAVLGMFEVQVTPQIRIGYAYDYTLTRINQFSYGSHELMLRYEFDLFKSEKSSKILSPRYY